MSRERRIEAHFDEHDQHFNAPGGEEHGYSAATGPYEYLLGALAGCFYYTLASYERKCSWDHVGISVIGKKRESIPATLEETELKITAYGTDDRDEFESLVRRAEKECSIYNTISKVSNITLSISYREDAR